MTRNGKWLIVTAIIILILLLFRMKAIAPASILSFILFLAALIERVVRIQTIRKGMKEGYGHTMKSEMSLKEAREMFELSEKYTKDDVKKAYHRLIKKIHPDTGGSKYLSSQINMAKDILLKNIGEK